MPNSCKPPKTRVKIMPHGGMIVVERDDARIFILSPADALRHGECLGQECLRATEENRLACPQLAALDLPPCQPREGFLIAERLLLLACRVGMAWAQTCVMGPVDDEDGDGDGNEQPDLEPDGDDESGDPVGGPPVVEMLKRDLATAGVE